MGIQLTAGAVQDDVVTGASFELLGGVAVEQDLAGLQRGEVDGVALEVADGAEAVHVARIDADDGQRVAPSGVW